MYGAIKWGGGSKERLVKKLAKYLPTKILGKYIELFIGGGSLFFYLCELAGGGMPLGAKGAIIADKNARLINYLLVLRDNLLDLIVALTIHQHEYMSSDQELYFHKIREELNTVGTPKGDVRQAANFYFILATCHCGLYRESNGGKCNSSFGHNRKPIICPIDRLTKCSLALAGVDIICSDFEHIASIATTGDYLYADPPYHQAYSQHVAGGFNLKDHERLRDLCDEMTRRGVDVMASNSDTDDVRDLYSGSHYYINDVTVRRSIGIKHGVGGNVNELVITNYNTLAAATACTSTAPALASNESVTAETGSIIPDTLIHANVPVESGQNQP